MSYHGEFSIGLLCLVGCDIWVSEFACYFLKVKWLYVNGPLYVCILKGKGVEERGEEGEGGEREKNQGHVFHFKWLLASKRLVDLGNLNKSTSWM